MTEYDSESRRMSAEVQRLYRAWCESCIWIGEMRSSSQDAERDRAEHDLTVHPS